MKGGSGGPSGVAVDDDDVDDAFEEGDEDYEEEEEDEDEEEDEGALITHKSRPLQKNLKFPNLKKKTKTNDEISFVLFFPDTEPTADLNCILFGDSGCNAFCSSISYLYGIAGNGKCSEDQSCDCTLHKKQLPTLRSLWSEKFKPDATSKKLLQTVEKDSELATEVEEILQRFPRTPSDTRDELIDEALRDIRGIDKLQIRDVKLPVQKYIKKDDDVDRKNLQQDVSQILQRALSDKRFPVQDVDYASKLKKFLNEISDDQTTKQYVEDNINKTDNIALKKLINPKSDNKPYDFSDADDLPSYHTVSEYVAATVTDEFVKFINNADKASKSPKNVKKPPTTPSKTATKKVQPNKPVNKSTNKYDAPGVNDFTSIDQQRGGFSRTWQLENGQITIEKAGTGAIALDWQVGNVSANLRKFVTGAVEQNWKFGNIRIKLIRRVTSAIDQYWQIQGKTYEYHRYVTGQVDTSNDLPQQHRAKWEQEIELWCQQNQRFFPYNECTIYKRR